MFKIYTVTVSHDDGYDLEVTHYKGQFSTLEAAEAAFKNVAEKFNIEINLENVQTGYANRPWENDHGDDYTLEIFLASSEVYESYAEEYSYSSRRLVDLKRDLSRDEGLRWN